MRLYRLDGRGNDSENSSRLHDWDLLVARSVWVFDPDSVSLILDGSWRVSSHRDHVS